MTGDIIIEIMFGWPGVQRSAPEAAQAHDYSLVQGIVLVIAPTVIVTTFIANLLHGWMDPRIGYP